VKIKVKDEMDDIRLKVSHQELVVILDALDVYTDSPKDIAYIRALNGLLFDKDEFKKPGNIDLVAGRMFTKIENKLNKIQVW